MEYQRMGVMVRSFLFILNVVGLKIARFSHLKEVVDISSVDRAVNEADRVVVKQSLEFISRFEQHRLKETDVCLFTNSRDTGFVIDKHPIYPQVEFLLFTIHIDIRY